MTERLTNPTDDEAYPMPESNPSLYGEEQWIHHYSSLSTAILDDKAQRFIAILNDPTTLPKHRAQVARLLDHIVFETTYRDMMQRRAEETNAWESYEAEA